MNTQVIKYRNYEYAHRRSIPPGATKLHGEIRPRDGWVCSRQFYSRPEKKHGGWLTDSLVWVPRGEFWTIPTDHLLLYLDGRMSLGNRRASLPNAVVDMFCGGTAPPLKEAARLFFQLHRESD